MDQKELIKTLHPLEIKVLINIDNDPFTIEKIAGKTDLQEAQARSGINWLEGKGLIEKDEKTVIKRYPYTEKGKEYRDKKIEPISTTIDFIKNNRKVNMGSLMKDLKEIDNKDKGSIIGLLKKNKDITEDSERNLQVSDNISSLDMYNNCQTILTRFRDVDEIPENDLIDKGLANAMSEILNNSFYKNLWKEKETEIYTYKITPKGEKIQKELKNSKVSGDEISQITPDMLKEKSWKNKNFREYNINLPAPHILIGKKHPYREYLDMLKYKFISLGFKEMKGSLVETEFWNMDSLYMPQTHPARDIHDNYFVKDPQQAKSIKEPYYSNVAETHENGGKTGSKGWGYTYNKEMAKRLLLRTQGTVLSARQLASNPQIPGKYFAMARCFRYDKVDATHLADFFQVEGIVISEKADFPTLLGLLKLFADKIAMAKEVKYVPGYFPFTEPSVEIHIKHPKLGWIEMGGAGIFRPEVTIPLGIDVPVIAWGLGVDRMAMMALGFNDIRDLFSRDLDLIRDTRMVI